jgi:hypothetical protein
MQDQKITAKHRIDSRSLSPPTRKGERQQQGSGSNSCSATNGNGFEVLQFADSNWYDACRATVRPALMIISGVVTFSGNFYSGLALEQLG